MDFKIGSKYEDAILRLKKGIRREEIKTAIQKTTNHMCYFCEKEINDMMAVLTEPYSWNGRPGETKYYLHLTCCQSNKLYSN